MISVTGVRIPRMKQADKRWRGFTVIELLLVVVIVAVMAALAVPNFGSTYARIQLRKAADDLAYHMRYAQSYAITKNTLTRLEFDSSFTQYWLARQPGDEAAQDAFIGLTGRMGEVVGVPRDIQISFKDGDPVLYFYPDGTIDKRSIDFCRVHPAYRRGEECLFISTQKQRGQVHVLKQSDESL